jgi:multicomponent Na+:H+ antiporter subunit C
MALVSSILVAILFAVGLYMLMRRNLFDLLLGTIVLGQATSILLISVSGWQPTSKPPVLTDSDPVVVVVEGKEMETSQVEVTRYADPIPQALLLTAIVIAFGVTAFVVALVARVFEETNDIEAAEEGDGEGRT